MKEENKPKSNKLWILYSFLSMVCFLFINFTVGEISKDTGPLMPLYIGFGQTATGIMFNIWDSYNTGKVWND